MQWIVTQENTLFGTEGEFAFIIWAKIWPTAQPNIQRES
jgi:hypothetical protein